MFGFGALPSRLCLAVCVLITLIAARTLTAAEHLQPLVRIKNQLRALTVTEEQDRLRLRLLKTEMPTGPNYGGCLYRGRDDRMYFFSTTKGGLVQQFELHVTGDKIGSRRVRAWESPICEAAVADDANHVVFLAEESVGIRRIGAEPTDPAPGELVLKISEHGVTGDLEGISLLPTGADSGCLVMSDQDRDCFIVIDRKPPHRFLGEFTARGASRTDGIDMTTLSLGPKFPEGAFGCHSDIADGSCIFLVPLPRVRGMLQNFRPR